MPNLRIGVPALLVGALLLGSGPASATESYDSCSGFIDSVPAVISTQGTWCLRSDLATSLASGHAISVNTNNVNIDCNGFKLGGLAAGPATQTNGIRATDRLNVTVRNCNIRGFENGVYVTGGAGHLVEDNRFDGNTRNSVNFHNADNVTVRRNEVFETGGAPAGISAYAIRLTAGSACTITDNTVAGLSPLEAGIEGSYPVGIWVGCVGTEVRANRVTGMVIEGDGRAFGIVTLDTGSRIVDNFVHGSHNILTGTGISGEGPLTLCQRNVVTGMQYGIEYCVENDNHVLPGPL